VLFLSDVFGYKFVNCHILADTYAAAGFAVYVPDILNGDPIPSDALIFLEDDTPGFIASAGRGLRMMGIIPTFLSFLWRHGDGVTTPVIAGSCAAVRSIADGLGVRVGCVGFCFGGKHAVKIAGGSAPLVDAAVACHPSGLGAADIAAVAQPLLFCTPELDPMMNGPQAAAAVKTINSAKSSQVQPNGDGIASFILYEGAPHGFAVRGPPSSDEARAKCAADGIAFLEAKLAM
jgi:dienelactone hydrolase